MIQLRHWDFPAKHDRRDLQAVLLCMLIGSMAGALYAGIAEGAISEETVFLSGQPFFLSALRLCLFPVLLAAALLLRSRSLFWLLFFGKGFTVSCVLCIAAASGLGLLYRVLPGLLFETIFPLPAFFRLGALWYGQSAAGNFKIRPVFPALLSVLLGLLLERLYL